MTQQFEVRLVDLGQMSYDEAYSLQKNYAQRVLQARQAALADAQPAATASDDASESTPAAIAASGYLLCVEHLAVLTVGRRADAEKELGQSTEAWAKQGVEVRRTNRGGRITYHGPGQLVLYPILDLQLLGRDLHRYIWLLEEVAIRLFARYGVESVRDSEHTGVWVGRQKLAAVGVHVRRWVSMHGISININPTPDLYRNFTACGIQDRGVASLSEILGAAVDWDEAKARALECFAEVFQTPLRPEIKSERKALNKPAES